MRLGLINRLSLGGLLVILLASFANPNPPQFLNAQELTPQVQTASESAIKLAAGGNHTCALASGGGVKCWGYNYSGQLGDSTTSNRSVPVNVSGLTASMSAIAVGGVHTCALTSSGGVKCWGGNLFGQLGDSTTNNRSVPVNVSGLTSGVIAIAAGHLHTCALTTAGGVKCWGSNGEGQLGDGIPSNRSVPVNVSGLASGVTAIAAGGEHTCALSTTGGVKCWGANYHGQLGDNTTSNRSVPVNVSGLTSGVAAVVAGGGHTCALTITGGVKCWGRNGAGQLGDSTTSNRSVPVNVSGLASGVAAVVAGGGHTCALSTTGGVKCWGSNYFGQVGDTTTSDRSVPVNVSGLTIGAVGIAAGDGHTCALALGGGIKCWGSNNDGQLGDGIASRYSIPVNVSELTSGIDVVAAGGAHTCALTTSGGVRCWGHNFNGQLGDSTTNNRFVPVIVSGLASGINAIATGRHHTCALTTAGGMKCWGYNYSGQLGDGTTSNRFTPVGVSELTSGVVAIATGESHTCALITSGGVKCWGSNLYGQLGDGTNSNRFIPVNVSGLTNGVNAVTTGGGHTCALTITGGVKCWGGNDFGELGDGTTSYRSVPVNVSGLTNGVAAIMAGSDHTCALTISGGVKCWGYNLSGQLGDGTTTNRLTPVNVSGLTSGVIAITTGGGHSCALTSIGGSKCWGSNLYGQLGDGTINNRSVPVNVSGLTGGVIAIDPGESHTCALTTGGGIKCWGYNASGQLGVNPGWLPVDVVGFGGGNEKPPIIILPGIMGTKLANAPTCLLRPQGEVWPNLQTLFGGAIPLFPISNISQIAYDSGLSTLILNKDGTGPANKCDYVDKTSILTSIATIDYYEDIAVGLENAGYRVYGFPYDWRQDLNETAEKLDVSINSLNTPKVILIGHSMGGLLARTYIANDTRAAKIQAVITVGTPYWGAPALAKNMRDGSNPFPFPFKFVPQPTTIRQIIRNSPGAMALLPSQAYFANIVTGIWPGYFRGDGNSEWYATLAETNAYFIKDDEQNKALLENAASFHAGLDSLPNPLPNGLRYYALRTQNHLTPMIIKEDKCFWSRTGNCISTLEMQFGDGTVPYHSAGFGAEAQSAGGANVCTYGYSDKRVKHDQLLSDDVIIDDIKAILVHVLNSTTLSTNCVIAASAPTTNESETLVVPNAVISATVTHAYIVKLWGDPAALVTNATGQTLGINPQGIVTSAIPNASFALNADGAEFVLPGGFTYTLTLSSTTGLPAQLQVTDFQTPDVINSAYKPAAQATFLDIPLQPNGTARMIMNLSGNLPALTLQVQNSAGQVSATVTPNSVIDQTGLADVTAPKTQISVQGTPDGEGFYTGPVTVTLTASDVGTGIAKTYYSVDRGNTWKVYTGPVNLLAEQAPIFMTYSLDCNNNFEYPATTKQLKKLYWVYLPTVQR